MTMELNCLQSNKCTATAPLFSIVVYSSIFVFCFFSFLPMFFLYASSGTSSSPPSSTSSSGFVWSPKSKFSPLGSEESHATGKPDGSGSKPEKPYVTKETLSLVRNLLSGSNNNVHLYDPNLRFLAEQKSKIASNFNQYKTI